MKGIQPDYLDFPPNLCSFSFYTEKAEKGTQGGWGGKHESSSEWIIYFFKIACFLRYLTHEVTQNKTEKEEFSGITYKVVNEGQEVTLGMLMVL